MPLSALESYIPPSAIFFAANSTLTSTPRGSAKRPQPPQQQENTSPSVRRPTVSLGPASSRERDSPSVPKMYPGEDSCLTCLRSLTGQPFFVPTACCSLSRAHPPHPHPPPPVFHFCSGAHIGRTRPPLRPNRRVNKTVLLLLLLLLLLHRVVLGGLFCVTV